MVSLSLVGYKTTDAEYAWILKLHKIETHILIKEDLGLYFFRYI